VCIDSSGGDVYTPLTIDLSNDLRLNHLTFVVGRVKRGVSLGQAQADMDGTSNALDSNSRMRSRG